MSGSFSVGHRHLSWIDAATRARVTAAGDGGRAIMRTIRASVKARPAAVSRRIAINCGAMKAPIVTLLTDFGSADPYVGAMKGDPAAVEPRQRCGSATCG